MVRNMFQWASYEIQSHGSEECETDFYSYITAFIENIYAAACYWFIGAIPWSFAQVSPICMLVAQDTVHQQRIFYLDNLYVNRFVCDETHSWSEVPLYSLKHLNLQCSQIEPASYTQTTIKENDTYIRTWFWAEKYW